jgi:fructan beta-fructosidase
MKTIIFLLLPFFLFSCKSGTESTTGVDTSAETASRIFSEKHRPQFHFSPVANWMNDPNGMVFHNGEYHLFFQFYPEGNTWGPMHWGHAVSKDLVRWQHLPIALYPDSLGWIFSGSAVIDAENTTGFGSKENPPMVAIYTYHSSPKEKSGRTDYQYQGIAYSLDNGRTWLKYEKNPVLKNQGVKDFRDPKVFWNSKISQWTMILAVADHVELWHSPNLVSWEKSSEFGRDYGAHGGVWECPDLFELVVEGESLKKWVMLLSINPGGPNGGSATQYFVGNFDGKRFTPDRIQSTTRWLDYGPDNYAGVTWGNIAGGRKIFLGWMSNWAYAERVPTTVWRSAMTLPRDLSLVRLADGLHVKSTLSKEVMGLASSPVTWESTLVEGESKLDRAGVDSVHSSILSGTIDASTFVVEYSNTLGQKLTVGYDKGKNHFYINRAMSGKNDFAETFIPLATAPRIANADTISFTIVVDVSSVEVFFDGGVSLLTSLYFPDENLSAIRITSPEKVSVRDLEFRRMKSIWSVGK